MATGSFETQNKFVLVSAAVAGLYLPKVEKLIKSRLVLTCLKLIPLLIVSVMLFQLVSDINLMLSVKPSLALKFDFVRRVALLFGIVVKVLYVRWRRYKFEELFELWNKSFKEHLFEEERQKRFLSGRNISKKILIITWIWNILTLFILVLPAGFKDKLPEKSIIPLETSTLNIALLTAYLICVRGAIIVTSATGFDSITLAIMSYIIIQLQHLKFTLASIVAIIPLCSEDKHQALTHCRFVTSIERVVLSNKQRRAQELLYRWIKHHQDVLRFTEMANELLQPILTMELSICGCYLVLASMQIAEGSIAAESMIGKMLYLMGNYFITMILATRGDQIKDQSAAIFDEAFSETWFMFPPRLKSCFKIIILRTQRNLTFKIWKIFSFGIGRVAQILQMSYNTFTFMLYLFNNNKI